MDSIKTFAPHIIKKRSSNNSINYCVLSTKKSDSRKNVLNSANIKYFDKVVKSITKK